MRPSRVILHCSDSPNGKHVPASEIRRWHTERGFVGPDGVSGTHDDIGYHYIIQPDGEVERGRGLNEPGSHCEGENHDSVGICLVGKSRFSKEQFSALRRVLDDLKMVYDIRPWMIFCHYEFDSARKQGKTCPNMDTHRLNAWFLGQLDEAIWPYLLTEQERCPGNS